MDLNGAAVVVTGGAGGLGEGAVRAFAEQGASVVVADLDDGRGRALAESIGSAARYVRTDVLDDDAVTAALDAAAALGELRGVVTAHGGFGVAERLVGRDGSPAHLEGFRKTIELYLTGTYNVARLGAARMAASTPLADGERGVIVTTASIAAYEGQVGQTSYAAAKGGVVGLTLPAARDLGPLGIRMVCIAPGTMYTPAMAKAGEAALERFASAVPFPRRLGSAREYGELAVHIFRNGYLNGEVIRLDGAQRFQPK